MDFCNKFTIQVDNAYDARRLYDYVKTGIVHSKDSDFQITFFSLPEYDKQTPLSYWLDTKNPNFVLDPTIEFNPNVGLFTNAKKIEKASSLLLYYFLPKNVLQITLALNEWEPLLLNNSSLYFDEKRQESLHDLRQVTSYVNKTESIWRYYIPEGWFVLYLFGNVFYMFYDFSTS